MKLSQFPKNCKVAKLKPLHKKGATTDLNNFKPISLLPSVSIIVDKARHIQTMKYLMENNIFYRYQSGFRKNHSTGTSLSYLRDKILTDFDSSLMNEMIFIDLQNAFEL